MKKNSGLFPWHYWMWLIHAVFLFLMYCFFSRATPDWFKASFPAVSLAHENNYAVWWAGICLLLASLIFYRIGSLKQLSTKESLPWYLLAVVIVALSIDELGSLHEMVSEFFGWLGLLPFAMVFGIAFAYALITLSINKRSRLSAILVLIAIGLFVMVAGLEFVEHNVHFESYAIQRLRLIGEEGTELVSASLLIISGLVALARYNIKERNLRLLAGNFTGLSFFSEIVFLFFILHIIAMLTYIIPNGYDKAGDPASIFPLYLFFITSMSCFYRAGKPGAPSFLRITGIILLLTSLSQAYNFNRFVNNLLTIDNTWFTAAPGSWLVTLIPLIILSWALCKSKYIAPHTVLRSTLVILGVVLLTYPAANQFNTYFLYSGSVAYACFWLLEIASISSQTTK